MPDVKEPQPEKKKRWCLWTILGSCGCCFTPFIIGLIIGMVVINSICDAYYKYWNNWWSPIVRKGGAVIVGAPLGPGGSLAALIAEWQADRKIRAELDKYCGTNGSIYGSFYNVLCNVLQAAQQYIGKVRFKVQGNNDNTLTYDCSAWVGRVLRDLGIPDPPRNTQSMSERWDSGNDPFVKPIFQPPLAKKRLTQEQAQLVRPGDIIIVTKNPPDRLYGGNSEHVGFIASVDFNNEQFVWLDNSSHPFNGVGYRTKSWNYTLIWNIYRVVGTSQANTGSNND